MGLGMHIQNWGAALLGFCLVMMWAMLKAHSANIVTTRDGGGRIDTLHAQYHSQWAGGLNRHVIDGYCGSACTLKLSYPNTCVTPRAKFMFHHGYIPMLGWELHSAEGSAYMMRHYPPRIRAWISAQGGLTHKKLWLDYRGARRLGIRAC